MKSKRMHTIFIYGSLKRGFHNHPCLSGQQFLGDASTAPSYRLLSLGGFPGMIEVGRRGRSIQGEVWRVDAACKARLDVLEGVEWGHYRCAPVRLLDNTFADLEVLTYLYARETNGLKDAGTVWRNPFPKST
jgi:gamma-glutamylaminecyclotransferase